MTFLQYVSNAKQALSLLRQGEWIRSKTEENKWIKEQYLKHYGEKNEQNKMQILRPGD